MARRKREEIQREKERTKRREKENAMAAIYLNDDRVLSLDDVLDVGKIHLNECERAS